MYPLETLGKVGTPGLPMQGSMNLDTPGLPHGKLWELRDTRFSY